MAFEPEKTVVVGKLELIAQLDSARWRLSRDCREFGDDLSGRLSVKGHLQRSFQNRPSAWGLGLVGLGSLATRLIFRKKSRANDKGTSLDKGRRPPLSGLLMAAVSKTLLLAIEPLIATVLKKERVSTPRKRTTHA